jgi:hypothetical protein
MINVCFARTVALAPVLARAQFSQFLFLELLRSGSHKILGRRSRSFKTHGETVSRLWPNLQCKNNDKLNPQPLCLETSAAAVQEQASAPDGS